MKRVLVIGDAILDVYRECSFKKECPDAPGVRAVVQNSVDERAGGAANVAVNLAALAPDIQVDLIAAISGQLRSAIKCLAGGHVDLNHAVQVYSGLIKERVIVDEEFAIRVDNAHAVTSHEAMCVEENLDRYLSEHTPDLIVLSDYDGGTITQASFDRLLGYRDRLLVDTKRTGLSVFAQDGKRTLLVKLNEAEWKAAVRLHHSPEEFFSFMIVTRGDIGADLVINQQAGCRSLTRRLHVASHPVAVADVCGCGDTFLAGLAAGIAAGHDMYTAMQFANAAASTVVSKPRTEVADLEAALKLIGRTEL